MNDSVVAIVSAFFVIGIVVGVIAVVAMSVLRRGRRGGGPPPSAGWGDAEPDGQPRWPGDVDSEFTSG